MSTTPLSGPRPWVSAEQKPDALIPGTFYDLLRDYGKPAERSSGFRLPGIIDLHLHGAFGWDFAFGDPDRIDAMLDHLLSHGLTWVLATLITCSEEQRCRALEAVKTVQQRRRHPPFIAGVYLEGPFLAPSRRGSHPESLLMKPDLGAVQRWQQIAGGLIRVMTVAPELDGALDFIRQLKGIGIRAAIGHTDADHLTTERAILAGATHVTHLFNAMRPFSHRDPTTVSAVFARPDVTVELIGDGIHVAPEIANMTFNLLDSRRICLVSDGVCPLGLPDGQYDAYETRLELKDGRCTFVGGHLFGGGMPLVQQIRVLNRKARIPLLRLGESLSRTPAKVLGLQIADTEVYLDRDFSWAATRWKSSWYVRSPGPFSPA